MPKKAVPELAQKKVNMMSPQLVVQAEIVVGKVDLDLQDLLLDATLHTKVVVVGRNLLAATEGGQGLANETVSTDMCRQAPARDVITVMKETKIESVTEATIETKTETATEAVTETKTTSRHTTSMKGAARKLEALTVEEKETTEITTRVSTRKFVVVIMMKKTSRTMVTLEGMRMTTMKTMIVTFTMKIANTWTILVTNLMLELVVAIQKQRQSSSCPRKRGLHNWAASTRTMKRMQFGKARSNKEVCLYSCSHTVHLYTC